MSRETQIQRRGRCRRVADSHVDGSRREGAEPARKARGGYRAVSSEFAFEEGHLEDFFMEDRTVAEVALFAEQLAVVRGNGDVGVFGDQIEQLFRHLIQ